jgi:hypothetical protein
MSTELLHQRAIDLLDLHKRCYNEMMDLQDHILNYGIKYYEVLPKSKLEHQFAIKQNALKRLEKRYIDVLNSLLSRTNEGIFY